MDIFFQDPTAIPLPPEDVRIIVLRAEPLPDHRRVRIFLETTPFQKRPNGEVIIANPLGDEVANVSIVESVSPRMEFIMHLRGVVPPGEYQLSAVLYYDLDVDKPDSPSEPREKMVVDEGGAKFEIQE